MDVKNKRFTNILSVARAALTNAAQDELIDTNPLYGWSYARPDAPKAESDIDPFSQDEQQAVLRLYEPMMANQVQFAFWTGLRTSELLAVEWSDADMQRGVVIVRKAMAPAGKGEAEDTKTRAGRCEVKQLGPSLAALEAQRAHSWPATRSFCTLVRATIGPATGRSATNGCGC